MTTMIYLVGEAFYKEQETRRKIAKFILEAKRFSFDQECKKFETAFAKWQGRKHAIFVNSGSSANLALIQALCNERMLKRGDKVGFSAVTWSTNVMPLVALGLTPVPVDIELDTLNVSSTALETAVKKHKLKAMFITNLYGLSHDLKKIQALCKRNKVLLLEDNCESFGSVVDGVTFGNFGFASTFSTFVGHHLSTIEGGFVCTDDDAFADALRIVRAHGWDRHLSASSQQALRSKYHIDPFYGLFAFYDIGHNFRPTEIQGFIGNIQLPYADTIVTEREKLFKEFIPYLKNTKDYQFPRISHLDTFSAFSLLIICSSQEAKVRLLKACEGVIESRPFAGGNMVGQPFFKKYFPGADKKYPCPNAAYIHTHGVFLPIYPRMKLKDKKIIIQLLKSL